MLLSRWAQAERPVKNASSSSPKVIDKLFVNTQACQDIGNKSEGLIQRHTIIMAQIRAACFVRDSVYERWAALIKERVSVRQQLDAMIQVMTYCACILIGILLDTVSHSALCDVGSNNSSITLLAMSCRVNTVPQCNMHACIMLCAKLQTTVVVRQLQVTNRSRS